MGSFIGHALPGSIFFIMAFWWTIQITRRLLTCQAKKVSYYSTATFPVLMNRCIRWPVEPVVKILMTTVGMIGELYASTDFGRAGKVVWMGDIQHVTMYSMFCLSGVVDLLIFRQVVSVPLGTDYLCAALAFVTEAILFSTHMAGFSPLETVVHVLLLYVILACFVMCLVEYKFHNSALASYTRAYFVMLQGTWFYQVGFILYPPFPFLSYWDGASHNSLMLATAFFAWHMGAVFLGMLIMIGLTSLCYAHVCVPRRDGPEHQLVDEQRARVDFCWGEGTSAMNNRQGECGYFRLRSSESSEMMMNGMMRDQVTRM